METYYLSSLDSRALEPVRKCTFLRATSFKSGKPCVVAELSPPIQEGQLGLEDSLAEVVLANRHEGQTLLPIKEFPCFVFVCRPLIASVGGVIDQSDVEILGWGELYKSAEEAENHAF